VIPGKLNLTGSLAIYQGDTYALLLRLPDLSPFGGPSDLSGEAGVAAQLRRGAGIVDAVDLEMEVANPLTREVRLTLSPAVTAQLKGRGVWDLQVGSGGWIGTVLAGEYEVRSQVTR
jgi:hypothetical protein